MVLDPFDNRTREYNKSLTTMPSKKDEIQRKLEQLKECKEPGSINMNSNVQY